MKERLEDFFDWANLKKRFALEVRHSAWFAQENYSWAKNKGITWVSLDSPDFPREIIKTTDTVYLRIHGRSGWYSHDYSDKELKEMAKKIISVKPKLVYIFFNNDQAMLKNAQRMKEILVKSSLTD